MKTKIRRGMVILMAMLFTIGYYPAAGPAFASEEEAEAPAVQDLVLSLDSQGEEVPLDQIDERAYDGFICVMDPGAGQDQIEAVEEQIEAADDPDVLGEVSGGNIFHADSLERIEETVDTTAIDYIEPDYVMHSLAETAAGEDPQDRINATAYRTVGISPAWEAGLTGKGQAGKRTPVVAVMDTGIVGATSAKARHEDLNYSNIPYTLRSSRFSSVKDTVGHGTFVTGEIAAIAGNGKGISGLMPDVKIVPVKVMGPRGGLVSDSIAAMKSLTKRGDVDVINMSFGAPFYSKAFASACKKAAAKGIILVAAAGNSGSREYIYPASYDRVVGVAAVKASGSKWKYSQHNGGIDAAAPGVSIWGLWHTGTNSYTMQSGTSMAAPMVSALAAMVKSIDPTVKHDRFLKILKATSTDKGSRGYDRYYGFGIIHFGKTYEYMNSAAYAASGLATKAAKPKKAKIKSIKGKKKKIRLKIKKTKRATSYQIAIKVKGAPYYLIRTDRRSCTITGLAPKHRYYVKVRAVRTVDGVNFYGKWSKVKKVRTR